ncbi:aspartyl-phosphate phosphatase Spo0E family protein [Tumebacillus sp. DT12]|uniref:Aspartyl-phosphate phosphatase Spo0E family protein n=1 Tax=Tumebacillus lacus TaxID=2995335 RepID=A0ABT3WZ57_9BACL|nr:aspartyl-phosphate phosphatase Spo0E family protein [Tumebacillus lacus]MCX7569501.1 aspartyl-phosphate phosphatase Spo0E family protein [Tumebacillus lacus]
MEAYLEEIEIFRQRLSEVVCEHQGNFLHPIVLQVSQQLDRSIVKYQDALSHQS